MSEATRFEARIGSMRHDDGTLMVTGRLSGYAMQSLSETGTHGAASITIRLFDLGGVDFEETSKIVRAHLAPLARRGVTIEVIAA